MWNSQTHIATYAQALSTMVIDVAEAWASGAIVSPTVNTASGNQSIFYAVGGINQNASFGLGVWNMMVWGMNENGIDMTGALYDGTNWTKMPEGETDSAGTTG